MKELSGNRGIRMELVGMAASGSPDTLLLKKESRNPMDCSFLTGFEIPEGFQVDPNHLPPLAVGACIHTLLSG